MKKGATEMLFSLYNTMYNIILPCINLFSQKVYHSYVYIIKT